MVQRLDFDPWGFIDWRRRRMADGGGFADYACPRTLNARVAEACRIMV